jgi:hypothetical protein
MIARPPGIQALLDVFQSDLAELRFADLDAATLSGLADELDRRAAEVESQEAKLSELQRALRDQHDLLLAQAQRALAYARVYAERDPELTARLRAISLTAQGRRAHSSAAAQAGTAPPDASPTSPAVRPRRRAEPAISGDEVQLD